MRLCCARLHDAGHCALVCNEWWRRCCRAAQPTARTVAIASRPLLLAAVGKAASHAGQACLRSPPQSM
jgi:hypothetical protein